MERNAPPIKNKVRTSNTRTYIRGCQSCVSTQSIDSSSLPVAFKIYSNPADPSSTFPATLLSKYSRDFDIAITESFRSLSTMSGFSAALGQYAFDLSTSLIPECSRLFVTFAKFDVIVEASRTRLLISCQGRIEGLYQT
jgi:hypothetical protein